MENGLTKVAKVNRGIKEVDSWAIRVVDYLKVNGITSSTNIKIDLISKYAVKLERQKQTKVAISCAIFNLSKSNKVCRKKIGKKTFVELNIKT